MIDVDGLLVLNEWETDPDQPNYEVQLLTPGEHLAYLRCTSQMTELGLVANFPAGQRLNTANQVGPPSTRCGPHAVAHWPEETGAHSVVLANVGDAGGALRYQHLAWGPQQLAGVDYGTAEDPGYLACTWADGRHLVGVRQREVVWLRRTRRKLEVVHRVPAALEDPVAVWPGWQGREVIVVRQRGDLVRVPRPT